MIEWGRKDPAAATAWAVENLPPDGLSSAMGCFAANVVNSSSTFKDRSLPDVLKTLTPPAWLATVENLNKSNAPAFLEGAPEWFRPRVIEKLPGKVSDLAAWSETGKAPEWFQKFNEGQAAEFVRTMARRDSKSDSWPGLTSVPDQWQEAAALGVLDAMTRTGAEEKVRALPEDYKALLRAQLPNIDPSLPTLPYVRTWLGG
jgi:hypothetical protein